MMSDNYYGQKFISIVSSDLVGYVRVLDVRMNMTRLLRSCTDHGCVVLTDWPIFEKNMERHLSPSASY